MFDVAFGVAQSATEWVMKKAGLPPGWQPKNKYANALLWVVLFVGVAYLIYRTAAL